MIKCRLVVKESFMNEQQSLQSHFEEVHLVAKDIEGWLEFQEAQLLYDTASKLNGDGVIVEIGSWCSKSLTYIANAAIKNGFSNKIFSIDPFLTSKDEPNGKYETFVSNLKQNNLYDRITHIREKSQIAGKTFNEKIEFIFIDGFHKYEVVKQDFELFYPKIVEGGYIAFHDVIAYQGPTDLVKELAKLDTFKIINLCNLTLLAQKVAKLTEAEIEVNNNFVEHINSIIANHGIIPAQ